MIDINGFIWDSIYKESMKKGATEPSSRMQAGLGTKKYKCGQFKTTSKLIKDCITEACKQKKKTKVAIKANVSNPPTTKVDVKIEYQHPGKELPAQSASGSKDGLWSKSIGMNK